MADRLLELRFPARAASLGDTRRAVREALLAGGIREEIVRDIVLALDEACQNVIRHAYGPDREGEIVLEIDRDGGALHFRVIDYAPAIDPSRVAHRDPEDVRPGGIGTFLIREVMDEAEFVEPPPGCGNLLKLSKRID